MLKKHDVSVDADGRVHTEIEHDNLKHMALAAFMRQLPPEQRTFFKECKVVSVMPYYMPKGAFAEDENILTLDPDQLDWAIDKFEEFSTEKGRKGAKMVFGSDGKEIN